MYHNICTYIRIQFLDKLSTTVTPGWIFPPRSKERNQSISYEFDIGSRNVDESEKKVVVVAVNFSRFTSLPNFDRGER